MGDASLLEEVLALLRCPACGGQLEFLEQAEGRGGSPGSFRCLSCARVFPMRRGLPDFRIPECFTTSNRLSRALYNIYAPLYNRLENALARMIWPDFSEPRLRREIAASLELGPDTSVLEVCVGTGGNLPYIRARTRGLLVGLDISEEMLCICAHKVKQMDLGTVYLFLGCAEYLPFASDVFDRVLIGGGVSYFGDPGRALAEAARVATDDGLVVVFEQSSLIERLLGRVDLPLRCLPPDLKVLERRWLFGGSFYLLKLAVGKS